MKKLGNVLWGVVFIVIGIIALLNAMDITQINIFFEGWWTLLIIIPSFIEIFKNEDRFWSCIWFAFGILLLLCARDIIDWNSIWKLILPIFLIAIGLNIIFKGAIGNKVNEKIKELNKNGLPEYYATFSGQKLNFANEEFKGADLNAVFGGINLDLRETNIASDQVINASAIFGGIDIFVPNDVNVKVESTAIFGGVENKAEKKTEGRPTIYIKTFCLFGGVDIKDETSTKNN